MTVVEPPLFMPAATPRSERFFKLYALDAELELSREATKADLERAMDDHVLTEHALVGRDDRKR